MRDKKSMLEKRQLGRLHDRVAIVTGGAEEEISTTIILFLL